MAIGQSKFIVTDTQYVKDGAYGERSFCGRCFTVNPNAPYDGIVEVLDADGAKQFFGVDSDEYRFAKKYFSYRTSEGRSPYKLSFARWSPVDQNGWIYGGKRCASWRELRSLKMSECYIEFNTTLNKTTFDLWEVRKCTSLTPSSAETTEYTGYSLVNILNRILTRSSAPEYLKGAKASIVKGRLKITFPEGKSGDISRKETVLPCTGGKIVSLLGLDKESSVICSNFAVGEDALGAVVRVDAFNDDFGSFMFFDWMSSYGKEVAPSLRIPRIKRIAEWNANKNCKYLFVEALPDEWSSGDLSSNTAHVYDEMAFPKDGTVIVTFHNNNNPFDMNGYRYDEFLPMSVLAATDFHGIYAAQNYMFQMCDQYDVTMVGDLVRDIEEQLQAANINFYGEVQSVGDNRAFFMPGKTTNGGNISTYVCEMFLKEQIATSIINTLLDREIVRPTRSDILNIATTINKIALEAKRNSIISSAEKLDSTKRLYVNSAVGSANGYKEYEKDGYCISVVSNFADRKVAIEYVLVYNKTGQIRKISGTHIIYV